MRAVGGLPASSPLPLPKRQSQRPAPKLKSAEDGTRATAIFAGGCFWGIEGVFSHTKGVISAVSGYHGGSAGRRRPRTAASGAGGTGHAESVKVTYNPKEIRYDQLLQIFFSVGADPDHAQRPGPRSRHPIPQCVGAAERRAGARSPKAYLAQMGKSGVWSAPIVTKVESYKAFYPAEAYHQDFMQEEPRAGLHRALGQAQGGRAWRCSIRPRYRTPRFTTG